MNVVETSNLEYDISCPITFQIFKDPVVAEDGLTYEREAIEEWFKSHDKSPGTGVILPGKKLISNIYVKKHVDAYISSCPQKKECQYISAIKTMDDIKYYEIKDLHMINTNDLCNICKNMTVDDLKYLLINISNVTTRLQYDNMLIHLICENSSYGPIKYILDYHIENNYGIEQENNAGFRPIHYICRNASYNAVKYILDIYVDYKFNLECTANTNIRPIHLLCSRSTPESIHYMLNIYDTFNMDINCRTSDNNTPLSIIENRYTRRNDIYKKIHQIHQKRLPKRTCCNFFLFKSSYNEL